jgi:dTDP-4-amino-4,6-dideoxygalactose transaminase
MIRFLDLRRQYQLLRPEMDRAIEQVLSDATFIGGPVVTAFERAFADYQHASECIAVANATDGLEIAVEALNLPPKSEIIVPANSFIASAEAVTRVGHRVVFADIDPETYGIDLADLEKRITSHTRAVIAVHLYGQPCQLPELQVLAANNGLRIIEDAAQAHGAQVGKRRVGAIGDIGVFSFYPGKNLGAYGDGGAIVTNDPELARRCRMIANHGRVAKYDHVFEGRNSRLDTLQAAVLLVKLRHLDAWTDRRNEVAARYLSRLQGVAGVTLPVVRDGVRHAWHLFVIRSEQRGELAKFLEAQGIETGFHYPIALPKLRAYSYLGQASAPLKANVLDEKVLSLPMGEHLTNEEVDVVCAAIEQFFAMTT